MRRLAAACVLCFLACSNDEGTYDPADDDYAMAAISSVWRSSGVTVSLCEDVARAAAESADGCLVEHVTRGGGLGRKHTEDHAGGGCAGGACPYGNVAYVRGTVVIGGGPIAVRGSVQVGDGTSAYAFPYYLDLTCAEDAPAPCGFTAVLEADGSLELVGSAGASSSTERDLARDGAAACP